MTIIDINEADYGALVEQMKLDGHGVPSITHVVVNDSEYIGAFSIAFAPCLFFWMDTGKAQAMNSYKAFKQSIKILADAGYPHPILLISEESPFYAYLPKMGYNFIGQGQIFM